MVLYSKEVLELTIVKIILVPKCGLKEFISINWIIRLRLYPLNLAL